MLQRGDRVPRFEVTTLDGTVVAYADLWQNRNLLLISLPPDLPEAVGAYARQLDADMPELSANDTRVVITTDAITGLNRPGALVADRWGEVYFTAGPSEVAGLPDADELIEWLRYVQHECPECQGEAR